MRLCWLCRIVTCRMHQGGMESAMQTNQEQQAVITTPRIPQQRVMRPDALRTQIVPPSGAKITGDSSENGVVIMGAGPAGLTAAYELTRHNVPVVVLEQDPRYVG